MSILNKIKPDIYVIVHTNINFRWIINLNVKGKTKHKKQSKISKVLYRKLSSLLTLWKNYLKWDTKFRFL